MSADETIIKIMNDYKDNKSIPFWSFNDKLEKDELIEQIEKMNSASIGGFFMHARGGLITEYMGEEWFSLINECIKKAKELNMQAWAYDEAGWPSGFAGGKVPELGIEYQQKLLECVRTEDNCAPSENLLGYYIKKDDGSFSRVNARPEKGFAVYYNVNRYYIDALNSDAITKFIEFTHEEYYRRFQNEFGKTLKGFFTDEPQFACKGIPWSHKMRQYFIDEYGYDPIDKLVMLFYNGSGCERFRYDYYSLVSKLFITGFIKQIYDWCDTHNCMLTGHVMYEDDLKSQLYATAGAMSCYEYFHIPGMDWLTRNIGTPIIPKQLSSAARQLGKKQTITETFALCGWDISFNELKWIAQWQLVNGVNLICQHLEGYTLRGFRKRDYPPSLFIQQPWFEEYKHFNEYTAKLGKLLESGSDTAEVLVIHPLKSSYLLSGYDDKEKLLKLDRDFADISTFLSSNQIEYHFGDEDIISKHGSIYGKNFKIGNCSYKKVVIPALLTLKESTFKLLLAFAQNGGEIYSLSNEGLYIDALPDNRIQELNRLTEFINKDKLSVKLRSDYFVDIESKEKHNINILSKLYKNGTLLYYAVNLDKENSADCVFNLNGEKRIKLLSVEDDSFIETEASYINGKTVFKYQFSPTGSAVFMVENAKSEYIKKNVNCQTIKLDNVFTIKKQDANSLTLDKCSYRINSGEWQEKKSVIMIQKELLERKEKCFIDLKFNFDIPNSEVIKKLYLVTECPEQFNISVNQTPITFIEDGYFVDKSFKKTDISNYIKNGMNEIILSRVFNQRQKVYDVLFGKNIHETELNKLTYDVELENCYLTGDFSVGYNGEYSFGDRKAIFTDDGFYLCQPNKEINISEITTQGYYFFRGVMELSQTVNIDLIQNTRYFIEFKKLNAPAARIYINGSDAGIMAFAPFRIDVTDHLKSGDNQVVIKLYSSNRNLLGPHHSAEGESYIVTPASFMDNTSDKKLNDGYCFVKFGVEL